MMDAFYQLLSSTIEVMRHLFDGVPMDSPLFWWAVLTVGVLFLVAWSQTHHY